MIAAGVEGGRKRAIEDEWTLNDVSHQHRAWKRIGPPLNITAVAIAASLGVDLLGNKSGASGAASSDPKPLPATLELNDIVGDLAHVAPGIDTTAASREIARRMKGDGA